MVDHPTHDRRRCLRSPQPRRRASCSRYRRRSPASSPPPPARSRPARRRSMLLLVTLSVAAVVWASASAPWWAPASASGSGPSSHSIRLWRRSVPPGSSPDSSSGCGAATRARCGRSSAVAALNVLIRSELDGFLGLSALDRGLRVASPCSSSAFVAARPPCDGGPGSVPAPSAPSPSSPSPVLTVSAVGARSDVADGVGLATQAIATLNDGDYSAAADQFADASNSFRGRRPTPRRRARRAQPPGAGGRPECDRRSRPLSGGRGWGRRRRCSAASDRPGDADRRRRSDRPRRHPGRRGAAAPGAGLRSKTCGS